MFKLFEFSELDRQKWEELLGASPAATFFHTAEWARLWEESYAFFKSYFLVDIAPDGSYRAGLPFVKARKLLTGYYSMPMGSYGGALGRDLSGLYRAWLMQTRTIGRERLVVFSAGEQPVLEELGFQKKVHFSYRLNIPIGGRPVFSRSLESQIGEALQAGFSFVRIEKTEDLSRFFSFSGRGRKKKFYTKVFYEKLAQILLPRKQAAWFLAVREGRTAGFLLGFPFREEFFLWDADFDPAFSKLRPGYFLLARVLEWACNKGFKRINFGQTPKEAESVTLLKKRMGGNPVPVYAYSHSSRIMRKVRGTYEKIRGRA